MKATGNHLLTFPKNMASQIRKQERVENMEAKNLPHGRTLTTMHINVCFMSIPIFTM